MGKLDSFEPTLIQDSIHCNKLKIVSIISNYYLSGSKRNYVVCDVKMKMNMKYEITDYLNFSCYEHFNLCPVITKVMFYRILGDF